MTTEIIWDKVYQTLSENWFNHYYGLSIDSNIPFFLDKIQLEKGSIAFVCYKKKESAKKGYHELGITDKNSKIGLAIGESDLPTSYNLETNIIIYCTTGKLKNIIFELIKNGKTEKLGWICIVSWDAYDANAYIIANSIMYHEIRSCHVALLSTSKWSHLPMDNIPSTECPSDNVKIIYGNYGENAETLTLTVKSPTVYYGPRPNTANKNVKYTRHPALFPAEYNIVIDTLLHDRGNIKKKPITKFLADIRADSISSGTVYRCMIKSNYDGLNENEPITNFKGLDDAIIYLRYYNLNPSIYLGPNHPQDEIHKVENLLNEMKLEQNEIRSIMSLQLGIVPGLFHLAWNTIMEKNADKSEERTLYISSLLACLISTKPTEYADKDAFKKFVGRNDIETLCNMWSDFILINNAPFWNWKINMKQIDNWCKSNSFNKVPMIRLLNKMKKICKPLKGEPKLFNKITSRELLQCNKILHKICGTVTREAGSTEWNFNDTLPNRDNQKPETFVPVLVYGKNIYIQLGMSISVSNVKAEDVSIFYDL